MITEKAFYPEEKIEDHISGDLSYSKGSGQIGVPQVFKSRDLAYPWPDGDGTEKIGIRSESRVDNYFLSASQVKGPELESLTNNSSFSQTFGPRSELLLFIKKTSRTPLIN
jgi:hypothetical protein